MSIHERAAKAFEKYGATKLADEMASLLEQSGGESAESRICFIKDDDEEIKEPFGGEIIFRVFRIH